MLFILVLFNHNMTLCHLLYIQYNIMYTYILYYILYYTGLIAEYIGAIRTYILTICTSLALLITLPFLAERLPHDSMQAVGYQAFIVCLCVVGLCYGGSIALFYSIVFDIYGARNYRRYVLYHAICYI